MPRNGSGTYTLPSGNPVISGTLIQSTWANPTMADVAAELTNSLARNGAGGMTGPLQLSNGSAATPALSFSSETTMGLYRVGAAQLGVSVAGTLRVTFSTTLLDSTVAIQSASTVTGSALVPSGSAVPVNGIYLPAANSIGFATNTTARGSINAAGTWTISLPTAAGSLIINGVTGFNIVQLQDGTTTGFAILSAGMYFGTSSNHPLILRTNGADRVNVAANGQVTINSPAGGAGTPLTLNTAASTNAISLNDGTASFAIFMNATNGVTLNTSSNHQMDLRTNGSIRLSITAGGAVSISAPSSGIPFSVTSAGSNDVIQALDGAGRDFRISYALGGSVIVGTISSTALLLYTNNTVRLSFAAATGKGTFSAGVLTATSSQAFTATPTFNADLSNIFEFSGAMTANVTSCTLSNPTIGQTITIRVKQDGTGGRTFASPAGAIILGSVGLVAGKTSLLTLTYSAMDTRWEGTWTQLP